MHDCKPQPIHLDDYTVPSYLIDKVDLEFTLNEGYTIVKSNLSVRLNPYNYNNDLILMGEQLELEAVILNGQQLTANQYQQNETQLIIPSVPKTFQLEIQTRIRPEENTALTGLYKSSGNYCTQCEAEGFRRITYFLDRPDVMAKYTTTIQADEARYPILLSNGNLVASGKLPGGRHWVRWEDPFKKPSYLFALVAGDLEFLEDFFITQSGRRITLRIFVETGNLDKCKHAMQAVKKAMRWDEETYGREYDLEIYMIVAVSDFNMGAMENKGLNIFNTKYILAKPDTATDEDFIHVESVIAHEYFHNWSGNRITCRDWFQLSLKEGLTIFRDQSFTADTTSKTIARIHDVIALRSQQFPEDMGPLAHPVRPDSYIEINNFYTSTIYNKGAEVIRMMKTLLGQKLFREGMDLYFNRHDGEAVTIDDFVKAMEDAANMDLTQFGRWYSQAGTPVLEVQDDYDENTKTYTLTIRQSCQATPGQPQKHPFHIPVKVGLLSELGQEFVLENPLLEVKHSEEIFTFKNIASRPIPSLLRDFSAPVKIHYHYSDAALGMLFKYDTDKFNRWEAGQKYAINTLLGLITLVQQGKNLTLPPDFIVVFQHVLRTEQDDKWLLAEMLTLPSEKYLAEQMTIIDVEAIHTAREFMLQEIAKHTQDLFLEIYRQNHTESTPYEFSIAEVGKRQLKNTCLSYLSLLTDVAVFENLAVEQFKSALTQNMTDTMGALRALNNIKSHQRDLALAEFYHVWESNALVIDKWFALQAISKLPKTLENVKRLFQHPAFDIKNPNRVYALIGAFGQQNLFHFHDKSGEGYAFLVTVVQQLDGLNPQVAARMVQPLINWRRYDKQRQALMCQQLETLIKNNKLSADLYEVVSKSLRG
jgi:aminopeptidase N